jgi:hypothetical protein
LLSSKSGLGSAEGSSNEVGAYDESMHYSPDYDMILRLARTNEGVFIDDPALGVVGEDDAGRGLMSALSEEPEIEPRKIERLER